MVNDARFGDRMPASMHRPQFTGKLILRKTNAGWLALPPGMVTPAFLSMLFARDDDVRTMNRLACTMSLVLVAMSYAISPAQAGENYAAAGIALIARYGERDLIFLVRHHKRSWYEMPGGRRLTIDDTNSGRSQHDETAYDTAIRECYEESRGFLRPELLRDVVDPARRLQDDKFVYFVAKIKWFPLSELPAAPDANDESMRAFHEAVDFAWVPVTNVIESEDGTAVDLDGHRIELRKQLKPRLIRAGASGWL